MLLNRYMYPNRILVCQKNIVKLEKCSLLNTATVIIIIIIAPPGPKARGVGARVGEGGLRVSGELIW